jgi:hypothetical protein
VFVKIYNEKIPYHEMIIDYFQFYPLFADIYRVFTWDQQKLETTTTPTYNKEVVKINNEFQYRNFMMMECVGGEAEFHFADQKMDQKILPGQTIMFPASFLFPYTITSKECVVNNLGFFLDKKEYIIRSRSD